MADPQPFSPVVVTPTYNNASTLGDILRRIDAIGLPVIVVNDGSTDATADFLERWRQQPHAGVGRVVTHQSNRGKAAALRSGFQAAADEGFTHAITIDTDGQLDPEQIPDFVAAARKEPTALVLGCRDVHSADYPGRSRVGRKVSNLLVRMESGVRVRDSQCGFRVYPLAFVTSVPCRAGHYGFETEILARAGWAGCPIVEVPAKCRYLPRPERVSHFRPVLDSVRAVGMHFRLLARTMVPWPPHRKYGNARHGHLPSNHPANDPTLPRWRKFLKWMSPVEAWRQLRAGHLGRFDLAAGLATGVFIATLPTWGVQSALSLYIAKRLHLNPLAVIAGSQVSTPPVGPPIIAAAVAVGHLLLHGAWPHLGDYDPRVVALRTLLGSVLLDWLVGAIFVGAALSMLTFAAAALGFRWLSRLPQSGHA